MGPATTNSYAELIVSKSDLLKAIGKEESAIKILPVGIL